MEGNFLPSGHAASFVADTIVKTIVWVGPMLLLFFSKKRACLIPLGQMCRGPFPWLATLIGLCLTSAFLHTMHIVMSGIDTWGIFQPMWVWMSLAAAVIEEIAFRGLLFNRQAALHGIGKAAIINGFLFAVYHYPEFLLGQGLSALFGLRFWVITVMGIILSLAFAKWKNLTMTIIIHFVWNMLCFWFALA